MYIQKVFRNGNSLVVTIPRVYIEEFGFRDGTVVTIEKKGACLLIKPHKKRAPKKVDEKFLKKLDKFMEEHKDVLEELAKR